MSPGRRALGAIAVSLLAACSSSRPAPGIRSDAGGAAASAAADGRAARFDPDRDGIHLTPTPDPASPTGRLVPVDLESALAELDAMLPAEVRAWIATAEEDPSSEFHHGLGTYLRNEWGLWSRSALKTSLEDLGVKDPDSMSGLILSAYWRRARGLPIDLASEIETYRGGRGLSLPPEGACPIDDTPIRPEGPLDGSDDPWTVPWIGRCTHGHRLVHSFEEGWHRPTGDELRRVIGRGPP